jgi:hypothetical protein
MQNIEYIFILVQCGSDERTLLVYEKEMTTQSVLTWWPLASGSLRT